MVARAQSPGITQVPIFGDRASSGSGPTPPSSVDRFEASIIVGNVPAGDPAVAQAAPFRYIPDAGDGVGIATAIAEASLSGLPTRIRIRPGTYDLSIGLGAAAFTLPFELSGPISVQGSGSPAALAGTAPTLLTMGASLARRSIFTVDAGAQLSDLLLLLPGAVTPAGVGAGAFAVRVGGANAVVERVHVRSVGGTAANDTLRDIFLLDQDLAGRPQMTRVVDCAVIYTATGAQDLVYAFGLGDGNTAQNEITGGMISSGTLSALRLGAGSARCRVRVQAQTTGNIGTIYGTGHDVDIVGSFSNGINNVSSSGPFNSKIRITGAVTGSSLVAGANDTEFAINAPAHALTIGGARNRIAGVLGALVLESADRCSVDGVRATTSGGGSGNVTLTGTPTLTQRCRVWGCAVEGALAVAGQNNVIVVNNLTVYTDTGTGNEAANNIVVP